MKRSILLCLSALFLMFFGIACGSSSAQKSFMTGFEGMYVGELPCADCPGILTHITFNTDSTVALTSLYYDSDETSLTEWGSWQVNNNLLRVTLEDGSTRFFIQKTDSLVEMTDSMGVSSEQLSAHYLLKKEEEKMAKDFVGHYVQGDLAVKGSYLQRLDVEYINDTQVSVSITFEGAGKGCNFVGEGSIVNNQIEVDLSTHHEKFKSTMVIRFTGDQVLLVAPSKFEDRYDLMYFCGGGGSLCGDYVAVKE